MLLNIHRVEIQRMSFFRVRLTDKRGRIYEQRDVLVERVQAKGLVQCLEDMEAPKPMIDAARKYAADGGW